jgi:hypothetical protein
MSNSTIRSTLETKLKVWADAQSPKIPVAFEGVSFNKPATGPYLEPLLIPNITSHNELSGQRTTRIGIFEVRCWWPSGKGMGGVEQLADKVATLFPMLPKVGSVSIENTPYAEHPQFDESGWIIVPVLVMYRYEHTQA